jgi:hypothetical protein
MEDGRYRPAMLAAIWKRPPGYVPARFRERHTVGCKWVWVGMTVIVKQGN